MKLIKETLEAIMKPQKINIKDISTENKPFLYGLLNTMEDLSEKANKQTKEYEKMFLKDPAYIRKYYKQKNSLQDNIERNIIFKYSS